MLTKFADLRQIFRICLIAFQYGVIIRRDPIREFLKLRVVSGFGADGDTAYY